MVDDLKNVLKESARDQLAAVCWKMQKVKAKVMMRWMKERLQCGRFDKIGCVALQREHEMWVWRRWRSKQPGKSRVNSNKAAARIANPNRQVEKE